MDDLTAADRISPWGPVSKKQKGIASFFAKKSEDVVRKEGEAVDARSEQVRLTLAQRAVAVNQKCQLLVVKWNLPPWPCLHRKPGGAGRTKVAGVWVAGLYSTAERVAAGDMAEPSVIILPPTDAKKASDLPSWKPSLFLSPLLLME